MLMDLNESLICIQYPRCEYVTRREARIIQFRKGLEGGGLRGVGEGECKSCAK